MLVPWWYIPASWFLLLGIFTFFVGVLSLVQTVKRRRRQQTGHVTPQRLKVVTPDEPNPNA